MNYFIDALKRLNNKLKKMTGKDSFIIRLDTGDGYEVDYATIASTLMGIGSVVDETHRELYGERGKVTITPFQEGSFIIEFIQSIPEGAIAVAAETFGITSPKDILTVVNTVFSLKAHLKSEDAKTVESVGTNTKIVENIDGEKITINAPVYNIANNTFNNLGDMFSKLDNSDIEGMSLIQDGAIKNEIPREGIKKMRGRSKLSNADTSHYIIYENIRLIIEANLEKANAFYPFKNEHPTELGISQRGGHLKGLKVVDQEFLLKVKDGIIPIRSNDILIVNLVVHYEQKDENTEPVFTRQEITRVHQIIDSNTLEDN